MPTHFRNGALRPEDLAMCKRVLDEASHQLGLDGSSLEYEVLASRILVLFNTGVRTKDQLLTEVIQRRRVTSDKA